MPNMSYCRFQNTLNDLRDCQEHIEDKDLSKDELQAKHTLIDLCIDIALDNGYQVDREIIEEDE